jgi:hypothetical protein
MFLAINSIGKYRYIRILHSYREGKRCKHKPIMHLGCYERKRYKRLKRQLKDWKHMDRAATIIKEMEAEIANVKKHARPFKRSLNYKR